MKISFKLSDVVLPVDESKTITIGNVELSGNTDDHDTARMNAVMQNYPKFIGDSIDLIKDKVLPIGGIVGCFVADVENSYQEKRKARREMEAHADNLESQPDGSAATETQAQA